MKRLYNPIAIYNYNKGKYFIALDDGKVVFFKYEDGEISNDYSKDELEVFYDVYNSLKVDKEAAINLGYRRFNNKCFETFYDANKELYFWYEIIDGKREDVSREDLELLNYKYNNQCLKYAEDDEGFGTGHDENEDPYDWESFSKFVHSDGDIVQESPEVYDWSTDKTFARREMINRIKTIQRAIIKHGKTVAIVVAVGVNLVLLADKVFDMDTSNRLRVFFGGTSVGEEIDEENTKPYSYDAINEAIKKNKNLSAAEKTFFCKFKTYFDEVGPYMDNGLVLNRLSKLKVVYSPEKCEAPDVAGEYDCTSNVITMYSTDSFENCNKSSLAHEFFHTTQRSVSKRFTMELSNEAATREYIRGLVEDGILEKEEYRNVYDVPEYGIGYDKCMKVYYLLANLLDKETIKKYQATPSDRILTNALVEIERNASKELKRTSSKYQMEQSAIELLDFIDELRTEPDRNGYRQIAYSDGKYKMIRDMLNYYYKVKLGKSIEECLSEGIIEYDKTEGAISTSTAQGRALWSVMDSALAENVEGLDDKNKIPMGEYRFILPRTYFSDRHQNPIVYFNTYQKSSDTSSHGLFVGLEITPEMEGQYAEKYVASQDEIVQDIITESSTDNVGGMGSIDVDRD